MIMICHISFLALRVQLTVDCTKYGVHYYNTLYIDPSHLAAKPIEWSGYSLGPACLRPLRHRQVPITCKTTPESAHRVTVNRPIAGLRSQLDGQ